MFGLPSGTKSSSLVRREAKPRDKLLTPRETSRFPRFFFCIFNTFFLEQGACNDQAAHLRNPTDCLSSYGGPAFDFQNQIAPYFEVTFRSLPPSNLATLEGTPKPQLHLSPSEGTFPACLGRRNLAYPSFRKSFPKPTPNGCQAKISLLTGRPAS
jgi:hypothetical protein